MPLGQITVKDDDPFSIDAKELTVCFVTDVHHVDNGNANYGVSIETVVCTVNRSPSIDRLSILESIVLDEHLANVHLVMQQILHENPYPKCDVVGDTANIGWLGLDHSYQRMNYL